MLLLIYAIDLLAFLWRKAHFIVLVVTFSIVIGQNLPHRRTNIFVLGASLCTPVYKYAVFVRWFKIWSSMLIKYCAGFAIALEVDEKFLDAESHSLMVFNWQKSTSPSHFLRNLIFGVISTTERHHNKPQITGGEKNFFGISVWSRWGYLDIFACLSFPFPSLLYWYALSIVR